MKTMHLSIFVIAGIVTLVGLGIYIMSNPIIKGPIQKGSNYMESLQGPPPASSHYATPSLPYFAMRLNGTSWLDQFIEFDAVQDQNLTLILRVDTDANTLPWQVSLSPKVGSPNTSGISWTPASVLLNKTSSTLAFQISVGGSVPPGCYPMQVDADTSTKPYTNFGWSAYFYLMVYPTSATTQTSSANGVADTCPHLPRFPVADTRKIAGTRQLDDALAQRPISKNFGVIFGSFDWSHDGKFLVFGSNAGNPPSYLWLTSPNGRDIRIINTPKDTSVYSPRISHDESHVYFIGGYAQNGTWYQDIFRCRLGDASQGCQDLTSHAEIGAFDFTPSGNSLVFVEAHSNSTYVRSSTYLVRHYNLLWLSNLDGKKQKILYNGTQPFSDLAMSPDGNSIVFFDRDNPVHPEDNGTYMEYVFPGGMMGKPKPVYLALFNVHEKNFAVLDSSYDYVYGNFVWTRDGNYIVADKLLSAEMVEVGPSAYSEAGLVTLIPIADPQNQYVLYGLQAKPFALAPWGLAISPDQKTVIFGIDDDYHSSTAQGKGIYRVDFVNPLP